MVYDYNYQAEANISCLIEDKDYEERREGFLIILRAFQKANLKYAVACSFNLFLRGIVDEFHGFDVIMDAQCIPKAKEVMENLGAKLVATGGNGFCESNVYLHYQLGRVDLDIISGFRVITFGTQILYEFNENEIEECKIHEEEEIKIPLISAEALFMLYCMMEGWQLRRRYKRVLIGEFLENHLKFPEIFERFLKENIPGWIKREIRRIMQN